MNEPENRMPNATGDTPQLERQCSDCHVTLHDVPFSARGLTFAQRWCPLCFDKHLANWDGHSQFVWYVYLDQ